MHSCSQSTQRLKCPNLVCKVQLPCVQRWTIKSERQKGLRTVLSLDPTMAASVLIALLPLALAEPSHLIGHSTLGLHPTGVSYSNRSPQGLQVHPVVGYAVHGYGKREAEPYYGYGSHLGSASVTRSQVDRGSFYGTGPAAYNYGFNIRGKRSADASYSYGSLLG